MTIAITLVRAAAGIAIATFASMPAPAQNYPPPKDGSWTARDFRFHTGETMAELLQTAPKLTD